MLLVYMAGNLAMKSVTTPILHRFGFRDVIRWNGALCVASLIGCGLFSPDMPVAVIYTVLFVAGMARSMNFTSMATLAFADVPRVDACQRARHCRRWHSRRRTHSAWPRQRCCSDSSRRCGSGRSLRSAISNARFLASAALMALAVIGASGLPADAGAQLSKRS